MIKITPEFPWQTLPANLIAYGIEHCKMELEFEQQVGYLLLDVGVETTLNVFRTLPKNYNQVKAVENKLRKQEASQVNIVDVVNLDKKTFHFLVGIAKELIEKGIFEESDWTRLEYFHGIRNKLYHQGDGVTTTRANLDEYGILGVKLLKTLLDFDLEKSVQDAIKKSFEDAFANSLTDGGWIGDDNWFSQRISTALDELSAEMSVITEHLKPQYTSRKFIREIKHIWNKMMKCEGDCGDIESRALMRSDRRKALSALLGQELTDFKVIDAIVENPSYLWFDVGLSKLYKNPEREFNRYLAARAFVRRGKSRADNPNEIDQYEALQTWIKKVDKKARDFIAELDIEKGDNTLPG